MNHERYHINLKNSACQTHCVANQLNHEERTAHPSRIEKQTKKYGTTQSFLLCYNRANLYTKTARFERWLHNDVPKNEIQLFKKRKNFRCYSTIQWRGRTLFVRILCVNARRICSTQLLKITQLVLTLWSRCANEPN